MTGVEHMALTFGTLLSSQGADALEPRPCGPSMSRLVCPARAGLRIWTDFVSLSGGRFRVARRKEKVTCPDTSRQTARHPDRVTQCRGATGKQ